MAGILSYVPVVGRLFGNAGSLRVNLPQVAVHYIETNPDRRARRLKYLLKANHANYSVLYHNLSFHNHLPHVLASSYLLGADETKLTQIYESETEELESWEPSPAEVTEDDWQDFLGDKLYQRGYVDFFEDQLAMRFAYKWRPVVEEFLFSGDKPLINGLIGGLGHPLIHLGYAYEVDSKELAMEALAVASVQYDFFHKYLTDESYTTPSPFSSRSPTELLLKLSQDDRFKDLPANPSWDDFETIINDFEPVVLEYWNAWTFDDLTKQFQLSQEAAVALLVQTVTPGSHAYNFLAVHLLTTSHAVRVLLSFLPDKFHLPLVRQWWLLVISVYIFLGRPRIDPDNVSRDLKGKNWKYVEDKALNSNWFADAHYVKAIRAMRDAARTWGDVHDQYLCSAVTFVDGFNGWVF